MRSVIIRNHQARALLASGSEPTYVCSSQSGACVVRAAIKIAQVKPRLLNCSCARYLFRRAKRGGGAIALPLTDPPSSIHNDRSTIIDPPSSIHNHRSTMTDPRPLIHDPYAIQNTRSETKKWRRSHLGIFVHNNLPYIMFHPKT